jgi:hypothetical protein
MGDAEVLDAARRSPAEGVHVTAGRSLRDTGHCLPVGRHAIRAGVVVAAEEAQVIDLPRAVHRMSMPTATDPSSEVAS